MVFREGLGSYYGTFAGKMEYFSSKSRDQKAYEAEKPNIKTNPSKKGTGFGYETKITITVTICFMKK